MAHLVTGYAGYSHIKSADEGAFNASLFGDGQYVMELGNQFKGSIIDNNTVRILDGDGLMYGRHFRIEPNTYEDLTITTGTAGKNRIDLICMTYEKNIGDETEKVYLQVIKGTETVGTPIVPEYTNRNILEGVSLNQMPLYKVTIEGVVLSKIEKLFETIPSYITSLSNPNLLINGDFQVWQRGESFSDFANKYTADRWLCMQKTVKTTFVEKSTDVPPNTPFVNSVKITDTVKDNSRFRQLFEKNLKAGRTYTLSFYAKSDTDFTTKTLVIGEVQDAKEMKGTGKWEKYVWTFTTTYELAGIELLAEFAGTIYFAGVKLEYGTVATPLVPRHYGEELTLCQRYYQLVSDSYFDMLGSTSADGSVCCGFVLPVQMRQSISVVSRLTNFAVFADKYYDSINLSVRSYNNNYLNFISSNKITADIRVLKVYTDIDGLKLDAEMY
jgi:hypothetical protein